MQRDRRPLPRSDPDDRDRQRGSCDQSPPCREPPRAVDMPRGEFAAFVFSTKVAAARQTAMPISSAKAVRPSAFVVCGYKAGRC